MRIYFYYLKKLSNKVACPLTSPILLHSQKLVIYQLGIYPSVHLQACMSYFIVHQYYTAQPWLVWLSELSASLRTKGLQV